MNSHIKHILFLLIVSFVSCVVYVTPYFIDSPIRNTFDLLTICVFWCAIFVGNTLLLAMISSYKITFAILFPCYTIMGGILSYFKIAFNATLTPMLIDASLNNDWGTSIELISQRLYLYRHYHCPHNLYHRIPIQNQCRTTAPLVLWIPCMPLCFLQQLVSYPKRSFATLPIYCL